MPLRDTEDMQRRMRSTSAARSAQPRLIDDYRAAQQRHFPGVGTTLSSHRPLDHSFRPDSPRSRRQMPRVDMLAPVLQPISAGAAAGPQAGAAPQLGRVPQVAAPVKASKKTKRRWRIFTKRRIIIATLLIVLAAGGWYGYRLLNNVQQVFRGSLFSVLTTTKLKGEDTGRVNILVAGNSADDPLHDGANLTDSIMIVSLDVRNNTAFMISVPRDLWVDIPGYGHAKINEAYYDGMSGNFSAPGYPSNGMGLLEEVIYENLGIKANYYALVDYSALRDGVNAVGGVDFLVKSDDPRGLYDPSIDFATHGPLVDLSNGWHHLNGEQALDLARARGDAYGSYGFAASDFERTANQRGLVLALKAKILSAGTFTNPVTIAKLFDTVGKNVRTDFTLSEVRRLYDIGHTIKDTSIQSIGLNDVQGKNYLANYRSPVGSSALIPAAGLDNFDDIKALIARLLSNNPVVREAARVVVLNGTNTSGLASKARTTLEAKGITVTAVGDAQATQNVSTIIDASNGAMPSTLALLKQVYGTHVSTTNPYANLYDADFIVVLGMDSVTTATPQ